MRKSLSNLRDDIDKVDKRLLKLLKKRFIITNRVGDIKAVSGEAIHQEDRWNQVLSSIKLQAIKLGLEEKMVNAIWSQIHDASKHGQEEVLKRSKLRR